MIPGTASLRVLERLRGAADGPVPVVHRGRHAVYVAVGGRAVGVLSRHASRVPCGVRTTAESLADLGVLGARAAVEDGRLVLDGRPVVVGRVVENRARPRAVPSTPVLQRPGPVPPEWLSGTLDPERAVALLGLGPGLTPLGDDVVAGWLAARCAVRRPDAAVAGAVAAAAGRTTLLSATLLEDAARGEVLPELAEWLHAAGTPAEPAAERALLAVGATSGHGLLAGARWALHTLAAAARHRDAHHGRDVA